MNKTSISYAQYTWNPLLGCSHASTGCSRCYAERLAATRLAHLPAYQGLTTNGRWNGIIRLFPERLDEPLRKRKPSVIFVGDMSDLFHHDVPFSFIASIWATMILAHNHTFLTLTKRPERMLEVITNSQFIMAVLDAAKGVRHKFLSTSLVGISDPAKFPAKNIWLGVTVENQEQADRRIPLLLKTPAAHRWVSVEPLLGPLDLRRWLEDQCSCTVPYTDGAGQHSPNCQTFKQLWGIDTIVCGGESGPKARPCNVEWIRLLRDQCRAAGTKCYVKQMSVGGNMTTNMQSFPKDLQVRELGWQPEGER